MKDIPILNAKDVSTGSFHSRLRSLELSVNASGIL